MIYRHSYKNKINKQKNFFQCVKFQPQSYGGSLIAHLDEKEGRGGLGEGPMNTFLDILFISILSRLVVNGWVCRQKSPGEVNKESY